MDREFFSGCIGREAIKERGSQGAIIQIRCQAGRGFSSLAVEEVMRAASGLDVRLPPVQVSLKQLFDTIGFGCLLS